MRWGLVLSLTGFMLSAGSAPLFVCDSDAKPPKRVRPKMNVKTCKIRHLPAVTKDGRFVAYTDRTNCHSEGCIIDVSLLPVPASANAGRSLGDCEARIDGQGLLPEEVQQVRRLNRALKKETWVAFDASKPRVCQAESARNKAWTLRLHGRCFNTGIPQKMEKFVPECPDEWVMPNGQCERKPLCRFENSLRVWFHSGLGVLYVLESTNQTAENCPPEEQDMVDMMVEYPVKRRTFSVRARP